MYTCIQLEKEMATHFSSLAWRIPWTEEPDGLQSIVSQRVRHSGSELARTHRLQHARLPCPSLATYWTSIDLEQKTHRQGVSVALTVGRGPCEVQGRAPLFRKAILWLQMGPPRRIPGGGGVTAVVLPSVSPPQVPRPG